MHVETVPTTRESHLPLFQSTVTLAESPNYLIPQLRMWALNQISSLGISTDAKGYLHVGAHPAQYLYKTTIYVRDYLTLDINKIYI